MVRATVKVGLHHGGHGGRGRGVALFQFPYGGLYTPVAVEVPDFLDEPYEICRGEYCRGFRSRSPAMLAGFSIARGQSCDCDHPNTLSRDFEFEHGQLGRGTYTQPGTLCDFPPGGEPYPMQPLAHVAPLPVDYVPPPGDILEAAVAGNVVLTQEEWKQIYNSWLKPWLKQTADQLLHDPFVWSGVAARMFFPGLGWVPLIAYGTWKGYQALR